MLCCGCTVETALADADSKDCREFCLCLWHPPSISGGAGVSGGDQGTLTLDTKEGGKSAGEK